jgi:hypothetical protein
MTRELWVPVLGFNLAKNRRYEVSNKGRVRANIFCGTAKSFISKSRMIGRAVLKQHLNNFGYWVVNVRLAPIVDGKHVSTSLLVHVLVASMFCGARPTAKHEVNHKDLDKQNSCDWNLEWVTSAENKRHFFDNGYVKGSWTYMRGEKNGAARLTVDDVIYIRHRRKEGALTADLADELGVAQSTICAATNGATWRHLIRKKQRTMRQVTKI